MTQGIKTQIRYVAAYKVRFRLLQFAVFPRQMLSFMLHLPKFRLFAAFLLFFFMTVGISWADSPDKFAQHVVDSKSFTGQRVRDLFPLLEESLQQPMIAWVEENHLDDVVHFSSEANTAAQILDELAVRLDLGWGLFGGKITFFRVNASKPLSGTEISSYNHLNRIESFLRFWSSLPGDYRRRLSEGRTVRVDLLPDKSRAILSGMVKKDGLSLLPPKRGFITISVQSLFNIAAQRRIKIDGVRETEQFRYYIPGETSNEQVTGIEEIPSISSHVVPEKAVSSQTQNKSTRVLNLAFVSEQAHQVKQGRGARISLLPNQWQTVASLTEKMREAGNEVVRLDPRLSTGMFFSSVENWDQGDLVEALSVAGNCDLEQVGEASLLRPYTNPVDDLQTESWISYVAGNYGKKGIFPQFPNEKWITGSLFNHGDLSVDEKLFVKELVDQNTIKTKSEFISDPRANLRLSTGPALQFTYYVPSPTLSSRNVDRGVERPTTFVTRSLVRLAMYWDWESLFDDVPGSTN